MSTTSTMPIIRTMIFLAFLSNSVSATSAIIDGDINLKCGPYLISVTTTIKDKVRNKYRNKDSGRLQMHYDYEVLQKNKLAKELNLDRSGNITNTEIWLSSGSRDEYLTVDRITGKLHVTKWKPSFHEKKPRPQASYNCKTTSRKYLNNLIKNHNKPINDSYSERKF